MKIAYTMTSKTGNLDLVLASLAQALTADGLRLGGVVQINSGKQDCNPCDMDVRVLPDGPVIRISQSLGKHARGCRLDPAALETAVGEVSARLDQGIDVLILNKFGKHEADGRGFRDLIGDAMARDIPVITGVNAMNEAAFLTFTDGVAERISPDVDTLKNWLVGDGSNAQKCA